MVLNPGRKENLKTQTEEELLQVSTFVLLQKLVWSKFALAPNRFSEISRMDQNLLIFKGMGWLVRGGL